jgi:hypothetical protein
MYGETVHLSSGARNGVEDPRASGFTGFRGRADTVVWIVPCTTVVAYPVEIKV